MRVGYETTVYELDQSGVARYVRGLADGLRDRVDVVEIAQPTRGPSGRVGRGLMRELAWFPFGLDHVARRSRLDVLHCPGHVGPPRGVDVPLVITLFDVMALEHPEWFTRPNALHVRLVWPRLLRHANAVIVAAEATRVRLLDRFAWLDPASVRVVPCGVEPRFRPGPGAGRERPYVLTVGRLQPRKNLETALASFEQIAAEHPEHELLIVGARGWHDDELVARLKSGPAADRVVLAGRVSDEELVALYQGAACFLFPSRYEGFGFPPLEAMACGAPVVSSDATSLPEVVGDAGVLTDPDDADAMAGALLRVLGDADYAGDLRARGLARAATFTWDACAQATVDVYAGVSGRRGGSR